MADYSPRIEKALTEAENLLDQIWEMVGADETDLHSHEVVERVYELLRDRYEK